MEPFSSATGQADSRSQPILSNERVQSHTCVAQASSLDIRIADACY